MSRAKAILNLIQKLSEEAKAVKPIVKEAQQAGGALMKEGQLAPGQKVIQKIQSGEEYKKKLESLKKAASIAGATGIASTISPEEAEAGTLTLPRKEIAKILKQVTRDGKIDAHLLLNKLGITNSAVLSGTAQREKKLSDVLGHVALEQTGTPEDKAIDLVRAQYPELFKLNPDALQTPNYDDYVLGLKKLGMPEEMAKRVLGYQYAHELKAPVPNANMRKATINMPKEVVDQAPVNALGVLLHEGGHGRDTVKFPVNKSQPVRNILNPEQSPTTNLIASGFGHHIEMPLNYELEKIGQLMQGNLGIPNEIELARLIKEGNKQSDVNDLLREKLGLAKIASGIAAGIGLNTITQDEAEAAGLETIAKKLGVTLEEAAKIKEMAKTKVPSSVFDENLKAIQTVSQFKKNPKDFTKLGHGVDYRAFQTPSGTVLKEPKDLTEPNEILNVAPSLVEQAGLGPKTKVIQVGDKAPYLIQEKVKPIESINPADWWNTDPILQQLDQAESELSKKYNPSISDEAKDNFWKEKKQIQQQILNRQAELFKQHGIDVEELKQNYSKLDNFDKNRYSYSGINSINDIINSPKDAFGAELAVNAYKKLYKHINPRDLHEGNIGLNPEGKPTIFDTSRFNELKPETLTPEMRESILKSNIALPEKKKALEQILTPPELSKVAAGAAGISMNGELGSNNQDMTQPIPEKGILEKAKEIGIAGLAKGVNAYEKLSPTTKENISATMDMLSTPAAMLREATYAAQKNKPIGEAIQRGWKDPEQAPTGEQIAEATGLSDEYPNLKAGIATAADFADPLDWTTLGAAEKLKFLGKLAK